MRHRFWDLVAPGHLTWEERFRPRWVVRGKGRFDAGARTYWFGDCTFTAWKPGDSIRIGAYCSIASGAVLIAGGNHLIDAISTYPFTLIDQMHPDAVEPQADQSLRIGHDVWIGARAMVVGDVVVGDGAVIAAGAVVVKDIPAYAVVAGVPATVVRWRFSSEEIATLTSLAWWTWPEPQVLEAEPLLRTGDVAALAAFAARATHGVE